MSSHSYEQPTSMGGHLAFPQNGILYTKEPPMSIHLRLKATFPVLQGWLLTAGSTVLSNLLIYPLKRLIVEYKFSVFFAVNNLYWVILLATGTLSFSWIENIIPAVIGYLK